MATAAGGTHPTGMHGWGVPAPRGCVWRPPVTATAADGTHPTVLHACY